MKTMFGIKISYWGRKNNNFPYCNNVKADPIKKTEWDKEKVDEVEKTWGKEVVDFFRLRNEY